MGVREKGQKRKKNVYCATWGKYGVAASRLGGGVVRRFGVSGQ